MEFEGLKQSVCRLCRA